MPDSTFLENTVKYQVQNKTPAQKRAYSKKKTPIWLYPKGLERQYKREITAVLNPLIDLTEEFLRKRMPDILQGDSVRLDAPAPGDRTWMGILKGMMATWSAKTFEGEPRILIGIGMMADKVLGWNRNQWLNSSVSRLGVPFPLTEDWWPGTKRNWSTKNFSLIRSLSDQYINRVNDIVETAVVNGTSYRDVMKDIKKLGVNISDKRASLIARDQIGKLNGSIQKSQSEEAGLDTYIWLTAKDERVRGRPGGKYPKAIPSHWAMEGKLCRWDDSSVYSEDGGKTWIPRTGKMPIAHPGMEIQCRCTAQPNWNEVIEPVLEAA